MNENNVNNVNQNTQMPVNEQNLEQNQLKTEQKPSQEIDNSVSTNDNSHNNQKEILQTTVNQNDNLTVQDNTLNSNVSKLRIGGKKVTYSLDSKGNLINSQMNEKKESKSMVSFVVIFFSLLLLFVFVIPTIYQNFHNTNFRTRTLKEEENTYNLVDGKYIELGTKAHVIDKETKIKFNNFKRETQRAGIEFNVSAEKPVSNINDYNIVIKVYDKDKNLMHISKFVSNEKIQTSIKTYYIHLIESAYNNVRYVEITHYNNDKKETLECTGSKTANGIIVNETIKYTFAGDMLISYTYTKEANTNDSTISLDSYKNKYKEEYDNLLLTNIDNRTVELNEAKLTYTIDLSTFKEKTSTYKRLYEYGDVYDFVKKNEIAEGRTCK